MLYISCLIFSELLNEHMVWCLLLFLRNSQSLLVQICLPSFLSSSSNSLIRYVIPFVVVPQFLTMLSFYLLFASHFLIFLIGYPQVQREFLSCVQSADNPFIDIFFSCYVALYFHIYLFLIFHRTSVSLLPLSICSCLLSTLFIRTLSIKIPCLIIPASLTCLAFLLCLFYLWFLFCIFNFFYWYLGINLL